MAGIQPVLPERPTVQARDRRGHATLNLGDEVRPFLQVHVPPLVRASKARAVTPSTTTAPIATQSNAGLSLWPRDGRKASPAAKRPSGRQRQGALIDRAGQEQGVAAFPPPQALSACPLGSTVRPFSGADARVSWCPDEDCNSVSHEDPVDAQLQCEVTIISSMTPNLLTELVFLAAALASLTRPSGGVSPTVLASTRRVRSEPWLE